MESDETLLSLACAASRRVESIFDRALAPLGIGTIDLEILLSLKGGGRWSIVSLARSMRWERSALSYRVRQLESRGLVLVDRKNQRRSRMSLTSAGVALVEGAGRTHALVHAHLATLLGDEAVAVLECLAALPPGPLRDVVKSPDAPRGSSETKTPGITRAFRVGARRLPISRRSSRRAAGS